MGLVAVGCTGFVPAATLETACGVAEVEGRGTEVLGLVCATDEDGLLLPQFQLFMLSHEGVLQPLAPDRQPVAAVSVRHSPRAGSTVHCEIAIRMTSSPSLFTTRQIAGGSFLDNGGSHSDRQRAAVHRHCLFRRERLLDFN